MTAITVLFVELALDESIQKSFMALRWQNLPDDCDGYGYSNLSLVMKTCILDWEGEKAQSVLWLAAPLVIAAKSLNKSSGKLIKGSTGLIALPLQF